MRSVAGVAARPVAAGRTDAGVHAEGQVAHVDLPDRWTPGALARALDAALPDDVAVRRAEVAPPGFDARRSAVRRTYRYRLRWGPRPVLGRRDVGWVRHRSLDATAMGRAARDLEGRHDFRRLSATLGHGPGRESTVRTVDRSRLRADADGLGAEIEVSAPSFLMHQVRRMVGALVEVGRGAARDVWSAARPTTAPASGLRLVGVEYPASLDPFR